MKYLLLALGILLIVVGAGIYFFYPSVFRTTSKSNTITSFEDCQNDGNLVVDTKPRECHTKDGKVFVEVYNGALLQDAIVVAAPTPAQVVTSPFKVEGKAIGGWYVNNQLTAQLTGDDGGVIVSKQINALGDTQTSDFVDFVAAIDFPATTSARGRLLISSPNGSYPTGEAGPLIIPVKFK